MTVLVLMDGTYQATLYQGDQPIVSVAFDRISRFSSVESDREDYFRNVIEQLGLSTFQ